MPIPTLNPRCITHVRREEVGSSIHGIPVLMENETTLKDLRSHEVQEVVFDIPNLSDEKKRTLYAVYSEAGYIIMVYDFPVMQTAGKKGCLREFDIEELLFRKPIAISDEKPAPSTGTR